MSVDATGSGRYIDSINAADVATNLEPWTTGKTMLTKAEEMKLFAELVSALPEGYVRDILTEATPAIESEIRNDCATAAPISGLIAKRDELAEEVKGLQEQAKAEAGGLKLIREELKRIQKAKEDAIAEIRVLARTAGIL